MQKANPLPNGRTDWLFSLPYSCIICIYPSPCGEAPSLRMQASSPEESLHLQYILPAFPYNPLRKKASGAEKPLLLSGLHQLFCDRVIVMHDGHVEEEGTPEEIIEHPKTEYTEQLIRSVLW